MVTLVPERVGGRVTATAAAALTTAVLPVFLLGALSAEVGDELGFTEDGVGAAVTVLFIAAGLAATPAGRFTERVGSHVTLPLGVALAGLATASVGLFVQAWWQLAVAFAVVGGTVALIDTGAARRFADEVPPGRQGSAFGLKEASVPAASLLAGLALPTVAGTIGWRGTFTAALAVAAAVLIALPRRRNGGRADVPSEVAGPDEVARLDEAAQAPVAEPLDTLDALDALDALDEPSETAALVRLAIGVGLGAGTATAAATFLVPSLLAAGTGPSLAGIVLSVASLASIAARILLGRWADDPQRPALRAMTVAIGLGATGAALLIVDQAVVGVVGSVLILAAGWGWTGLAFLAVVRSRPDAPAEAAGIVLTGLALGGAVGPLAFGAIASRTSYPTAWLAACAALLVATVAVGSTVRQLSPAEPPPTS